MNFESKVIRRTDTSSTFSCRKRRSVAEVTHVRYSRVVAICLFVSLLTWIDTYYICTRDFSYKEVATKKKCWYVPKTWPIRWQKYGLSKQQLPDRMKTCLLDTPIHNIITFWTFGNSVHLIAKNLQNAWEVGRVMVDVCSSLSSSSNRLGREHFG